MGCTGSETADVHLSPLFILQAERFIPSDRAIQRISPAQTIQS